jgi:hypothetical protein
VLPSIEKHTTRKVFFRCTQSPSFFTKFTA